MVLITAYDNNETIQLNCIAKMIHWALSLKLKAEIPVRKLATLSRTLSVCTCTLWTVHLSRSLLRLRSRTAARRRSLWAFGSQGLITSRRAAWSLQCTNPLNVPLRFILTTRQIHSRAHTHTEFSSMSSHDKEPTSNQQAAALAFVAAAHRERLLQEMRNFGKWLTFDADFVSI